MILDSQQILEERNSVMKNMKMYALDCGNMWLDENVLVVGINNATSQHQKKTTNWVPIPVAVFVIDHPDLGLIVYDTGCDAIRFAELPKDLDTPSPYIFTEQQTLQYRFNELGFRFEEVKAVLMSHLHTDHAGNLYLFKNADIYVNDDEFTQAVKLYGLKERYGAYGFPDFDKFLNADLHWNLVDTAQKETKIADGVTLVQFGPGHTFGMQGMLVELPISGNFFMVADALYTRWNLGPPVRLPGIVWDSVGYVKTAKFIEKYAKEHNAQIVFGHNSEQFGSMIKSTDGYYD